MKTLRNLCFIGLAAFAAQVFAASGPGSLQPLPVVDLSALEADVATQLSEARASVDQLLGTPGADPARLSEAYGTLGKLYHAYGLLDGAQAGYSNAGAIFPKQLQWPYLYAVVAEQRGDVAEAVKALKYVLVYAKTDLPARLRLARVYRENGQFEEASEQLQEILRQQPSVPAVEAELGELALAEGDNKDAVRYLSNVLKAVPKADRLHYPLAIAYRNMGEVDLAREHMEKRGSVGLKPADPILDEIEQLKTGERVHLLRGKLAFASGDYLAASKAFQAAVDARPDSARAHINLGTALSLLGQAEPSRQHFEKALTLEPDNVTAHFNLGFSALRKGELDTADRHLKKAVELAPEDSQARLQLAKLLLQQGQSGAAFEQYKAVARLNPASQTAWMGMANLLVAAQQYPEAAEVLKKAHESLPNNGRISHARARLLAASPELSIRDAVQARRLAYQVYEVQPTLLHAYTVSLALAESGECQQAAGFLEQAWPQFANGVEEVPPQLGQTVDYYRNNSPVVRPRSGNRERRRRAAIAIL